MALATAIAALSLLIVAPAPSYDPWAWLLWGREIAGGGLSTSEGPSFKPGAVIVTAPLALLGGAAPVAWVLIARIGAVLALLLAFRLGRRLAGSILAGLLAMAGVGLSGGYAYYAASGMVTGWVLALGLAGIEAWRAGRPRVALACGVGCALLHVESWPFLAAFGLLLWSRRPRDRPLLVLAAAAIPALWLVPELLGSGNLVRAAERAQVPNAGQPATADVPALDSLSEAAAIPPWPLWLGLAALVATAIHAHLARAPSAPSAAPAGLLVRLARGGGPAARTLAPAAAGAAWVAIVAAMSQLGGFSGEPRYAAPGMALIAVSGAVGLALVVRRLAFGRNATMIAIALALGVAAVPRLEEVGDVRAGQADQWELASDLADAVAAAGGREAVLRCGTPYVAPLRGPLMAYRLDVPKHVVEPDRPPRAPGVVFQWRGSPEAPALSAAASASPVRVGRRAAGQPAFAEVARGDRWRVLRACRVRMP